MYDIRRGATVIGGCLFLICAFITYFNGGQLVEAAKALWEQAKWVAVAFVLTFVGLAMFVWGMGWTMSNKERLKMKEYRKRRREEHKNKKKFEEEREKLKKKFHISK